MDNWAFIRLMTIGYTAAAVVMIFAILLLFRNRIDEKDKKDFRTLVFLLVPCVTFCLWLLWICMYMAQMNPMIVPIKHIHEHVEDVVAVAA